MDLKEYFYIKRVIDSCTTSAHIVTVMRWIERLSGISIYELTAFSAAPDFFKGDKPDPIRLFELAVKKGQEIQSGQVSRNRRRNHGLRLVEE